MEDSKYPKWLGSALKKDSTIKIIITLGLLGMILILISQLTDTPGLRSPPAQGSPGAQRVQTMTVEEYTEMLEARLEDLISNIHGVGRARVMVTLEHGVEYVFATEERTTLDRGGGESGRERHDTQSSYVLVDTEFGRRQPLVRTQRQPRVQGVIVVCEGANDIHVRQSLTNVITTALNIPTTRVYIVLID